MKTRFLISILALVTAFAAGAQVAFTGNTREVFEETPAANTGLDKVYVLYDTKGVGMSYTAQTENPVTWYTYGELGGGYAEQLEGVVTDGLTTSIAQVIPNKGYIIEEGTSRLYLWVTNYADYRLTLSSIDAPSDGDCGTVTINVDGNGPDIPFFGINGVRRTLDRDLTLAYNNLEWSDTTHWQEKRVEESQPSFKSTIVIPAPFENTTFSLSGDRFLRFWGEDVSVESGTYTTAAVDARVVVVQEEKKGHDNEKKSGSESTLGGSAPAHITFTAYCTDAVMHKEWQMSYYREFNDITLRINQEEIDQVFEDAGTTYWRFFAANADGTCEYLSDIYTVNIGESELVCPNVFTPGTSEGVNDVWKVSYRSIIDFHCWIFNRWGNKIIEFTDPSGGWDGTYKGKLVPAGVYYYVIEARGSDDKKYKLKGDINIIRYKRINDGGNVTPSDFE